MNKLLILAIAILVVVGLIVGIVFIVKKTKHEGFNAPHSFIYRGPYYGYYYGFGTPIIQSNWSSGAYFQLWTPLEQGQFDQTCEWCPRYIRNY